MQSLISMDNQVSEVSTLRGEHVSSPLPVTSSRRHLVSAAQPCCVLVCPCCPPSLRTNLSIFSASALAPSFSRADEVPWIVSAEQSVSIR